MRDLIIPHHKEFVTNKQLSDYAIRNADIFNIERLVEETLAQLGGYNFIDASHKDFDDKDNSDSKTCSIYTFKKTGCTFKGIIGAVSSNTGVLKEGSLRVSIFNPITDSIMFYYLPKSVWQYMIYKTPTAKSYIIEFHYNSTVDYIKKFDGYKVQSIVELALATG